MLNVLLVDDDPIILNTLEHLIPWADYNMQIIAKASNGLEALDILSKQHIHVVFTDLQMPQMDGITFLSKMHELNSHIAFIVISSYNDFPLVKNCFQYGILDYILKVDLDDLTVLDPLLKKVGAHFASSYLVPLTSPDGATNPSPTSLTHFTLIMIKTSSIPLKTRLLLRLEELHDLYPFEESFRENYLIISSLGTLTSQLSLQTSSLFNHLSQLITSDQTQDSCIISTATMPIDAFSSTFDLLTKHCDFAYWYQIEELKELSLTSNSSATEWGDLFANTLKQLDQLDMIHLETLLDRLVQYAYEHLISPDLLQKSFYTLFSHLYTNASNYQLSSSSSLALPFWDEHTPLRFAHLTEFKDWINETINHYHALIHPDTPEQIYLSLVHYLDYHFYDSSLSLEKVSLALQLSPRDIRKACTTHGNTHFKSLLNQIRIQKAQHLLANSTLKIQEISYRVGYANIEHFSRSFSKIVGLSPSLFQSHLHLTKEKSSS